MKGFHIRCELFGESGVSFQLKSDVSLIKERLTSRFQTTTLEKTQTQSSISHHGSTANTHYLRTADFRTSTQHFESCDAHRSALCLSMDVQALM